MATAHTLNMAAPEMARICLYGDLQRFGRRFDLNVRTGAEGLHALFMQVAGLKQKIQQGWYQVRIAGTDVTEDTVSARLHEPLSPGAIIHIVPRAAGAKNSGVFQTIAGAVMVVAGAVISYFSAGTLAAFGAGMMKFGAAMMLGGVAQMLAPKARSPSMRQTDNGKQNTYFSSLDNMLAQGNPLPVLYGEMLVGSRVISQEVGTRDEGDDGTVVIIGR
ncbi:TPA: tail assembly protein [Citrobacter amalonaticus]|nr:tail assembly protein [Citrobacter amalonaticus]